MPSRSAFLSVLSRVHIVRHPSRFHTSTVRILEEDSHYRTLNIPQHATRAEIRRRYIELSKVHHPDRNRNDPQASKRFVKISSAYAILGHEKHREKYDRELARLHGGGATPQHTGPAGGRPASGLSRRRAQFHGPPPSFFRNGGWSTFNSKASHKRQDRPSTGVEGGEFGVGGPASGRNDDVPHFNYDQKYRQHQQQEYRWAHRARGRKFERDDSIILPLIGITTILLCVISVSVYTSP